MRNRQQSRRNKSTDTEEGDPRCLLCSYYDDFIACFSCPLRRLYCLFLISITATIAWFSSPLDLTIWTKSAFLGVKGGSNEIFTYLMVFREVISFTYQKILLGDRVPLKSGFKMPLILSLILSLKLPLMCSWCVLHIELMVLLHLCLSMVGGGAKSFSLQT